ncbi:MAG: hypothetical protein HYV28_05900 [Ignavibacteriales bacterium]|nr:hypothetical protein [Ignavibacteriales bacterium]
MKRLFSISLLLFISLLFSSCKNSVPHEKIQVRNDVAYEVNQDKPYSGEVVKKSSSGVKEREENYVNGKLEGETIWYHDNGKKKWVINYVNGKAEGERVDYFEGGETQIVSNYKNGQCVSQTRYYKNGQKMFEGKFFGGEELAGNVKYYGENGDVNYDVTIDNNRLYNRFFWKSSNEDAYYLNKHTIPFDDFIQASTKSAEERRNILGKPVTLEKLPGSELYELVLLGPWWENGFNMQALVNFNSVEKLDNFRMFHFEIDKDGDSIKKLIENTAKYFEEHGYAIIKREPMTFSKKFGDWKAEIVFGEHSGVLTYVVMMDKQKK